MRKMCQPSAHCDKMRKFPQGLKHLWPKTTTKTTNGLLPKPFHFFPSPFLPASLSMSHLSSACNPLCLHIFVSLFLYIYLACADVCSPFTRQSRLNLTLHKALLPCNRFHQRFLLAEEEYMVIKGSVAKRDEERLHPAAEVEQEGRKREKQRWRGEDRMCRGKDGEKWGRARRKNEGVGKTKDKKALTGNERLEWEGHNGFTPTRHCCAQVYTAWMEMRLMSR